jgi:hypothetical protein
VQGKPLIPYRYCNSALALLFLLQGTLSAFGQDSTRRVQPKDTIFPRVDSLKAAIVTAILRPRMKGDTTEYNTDNIRLRANANVEELLRQLPGLQVDANGNIIFNGERIERLLVDGEDLFGGNPTLVTRNFDASKISRVQVLDRKTDQAIFTGIDDGTRTKTLNLVLKESAKDGYFGKIEAGSNTDGYYTSNVALAAFKQKEQFTALGLTANTGTLGVSNTAGDASGSVSFVNEGSDPLAASAGVGIPQFSGAALHYANTWNGADDHIVGNYQYSHFLTRPQTTIQTIQAEPNSLYRQNLQNQSVNQQDLHWLYGTYDWAPSSKEALKITFHGSNAQGQNQLSSVGQSSFNDTSVNASRRTIQDRVALTSAGGNISWRTIIKRPDRVFSMAFEMSKVAQTTNGFLYSLNKFYSPNGTAQSQDTVDQRKGISSHPLSIGGSLSYTEPIWSGAILAANYSLAVDRDEPLQVTYNRGDGKYQEIVDSLSSHFQTQTISQNGILNLQGKLRHLNYTVGSNWLVYSHRQKDLLADSSLNQHYFNLAPKIILNYTPNTSTNLRFFYTASTRQPSNAQLQPVKNNNDPLHINLGNPALKPAFNQSFRLEFHRLKAWLINLSLRLNVASKSISTKTITDSLGRQISQPVNVDGGRAAMLNFSIMRKVLGFDAGVHATGNYSQTVNYINADLNHTNIYTGSGGFSLNKNVPEKYTLQLNTDFSYLSQVSSVNIASPIRYWTQSHYLALTVFILRNYEINSNAVYTWQQKTSQFTANTSVLLLNGSVSRNILNERLALKAQWSNILNQNTGASRAAINNINTQTTTNILGRYWMLSVIYHFDKKFKQK